MPTPTKPGCLWIAKSLHTGLVHLNTRWRRFASLRALSVCQCRVVQFSLVAVVLIAAYLALSHLDRRANHKVYAPLAPTFRAQVILSAHPQVTAPGEWITPTHSQGKTVLLNFWASWCTSCRAEAGRLNRLQAEYASDTFVMVGMATADDPEKAVAVAKELAHRYVIAFDAEGIIAQRFGVDSLPQTFLIDATGRIRYHIQGPLQDSHWPGLTRAILQALTSPVGPEIL